MRKRPDDNDGDKSDDEDDLYDFNNVDDDKNDGDEQILTEVLFDLNMEAKEGKKEEEKKKEEGNEGEKKKEQAKEGEKKNEQEEEKGMVWSKKSMRMHKRMKLAEERMDRCGVGNDEQILTEVLFDLDDDASPPPRRKPGPKCARQRAAAHPSATKSAEPETASSEPRNPKSTRWGSPTTQALPPPTIVAPKKAPVPLMDLQVAPMTSESSSGMETPSTMPVFHAIQGDARNKVMNRLNHLRRMKWWMERELAKKNEVTDDAADDAASSSAADESDGLGTVKCVVDAACGEGESSFSPTGIYAAFASKADVKQRHVAVGPGFSALRTCFASTDSTSLDEQIKSMKKLIARLNHAGSKEQKRTTEWVEKYGEIRAAEMFEQEQIQNKEAMVKKRLMKLKKRKAQKRKEGEKKKVQGIEGEKKKEQEIEGEKKKEQEKEKTQQGVVIKRSKRVRRREADAKRMRARMELAKERVGRSEGVNDESGNWLLVEEEDDDNAGDDRAASPTRTWSLSSGSRSPSRFPSRFPRRSLSRSRSKSCSRSRSRFQSRSRSKSRSRSRSRSRSKSPSRSPSPKRRRKYSSKVGRNVFHSPSRRSRSASRERNSYTRRSRSRESPSPSRRESQLPNGRRIRSPSRPDSSDHRHKSPESKFGQTTSCNDKKETNASAVMPAFMPPSTNRTEVSDEFIRWEAAQLKVAAPVSSRALELYESFAHPKDYVQAAGKIMAIFAQAKYEYHELRQFGLPLLRVVPADQNEHRLELFKILLKRSHEPVPALLCLESPPFYMEADFAGALLIDYFLRGYNNPDEILDHIALFSQMDNVIKYAASLMYKDPDVVRGTLAKSLGVSPHRVIGVTKIKDLQLSSLIKKINARHQRHKSHESKVGPTTSDNNKKDGNPSAAMPAFMPPSTNRTEVSDEFIRWEAAQLKAAASVSIRALELYESFAHPRNYVQAAGDIIAIFAQGKNEYQDLKDFGLPLLCVVPADQNQHRLALFKLLLRYNRQQAPARLCLDSPPFYMEADFAGALLVDYFLRGYNNPNDLLDHITLFSKMDGVTEYVASLLYKDPEVVRKTLAKSLGLPTPLVFGVTKDKDLQLSSLIEKIRARHHIPVVKNTSLEHSCLVLSCDLYMRGGLEREDLIAYLAALAQKGDRDRAVMMLEWLTNTLPDLAFELNRKWGVANAQLRSLINERLLYYQVSLVVWLDGFTNKCVCVCHCVAKGL